MVAFVALRAASRRLVARQAVAATQKRHMGLGGHSGPPPEWEGIDKVVRDVIPHDHQRTLKNTIIVERISTACCGHSHLTLWFAWKYSVSAAILGGYFTLYLLYKLSTLGGKKKEEEPAAPEPVAAASTEGVPDIESPEFEKFLDSEALVKLLDSEEQLKSVLG